MQIGFLYAIGAAVTWGLVYALDQKILTNMTPMTLFFVGILIDIVLVLPFALLRTEEIKAVFTSGWTNLSLITVTILLANLANFFIYAGIKHLDASSASIIEIAYPFFVVLFSVIIFQTVPSIPFFVGGALIFIGSVIIIKFA